MTYAYGDVEAQGGGDAGSLVLSLQLGARSCGGVDRDIVITSRPHHHHHQAFHSRRSVSLNFCANPAVGMSELGSARRRRERQLRAWHRHEQNTVAMELATALHHSAQRVEASREGVEGEKYCAPPRAKPPLPGKRPAPLVEVAEPQARLGQHSGIGCELVLPLDVPVLQMVEQ